MFSPSVDDYSFVTNLNFVNVSVIPKTNFPLNLTLVLWIWCISAILFTFLFCKVVWNFACICFYPFIELYFALIYLRNVFYNYTYRMKQLNSSMFDKIKKHGLISNRHISIEMKFINFKIIKWKLRISHVCLPWLMMLLMKKMIVLIN